MVRTWRWAEPGRTYITLDDQTVLDAARSDPAGFIRGLDRAIINKIQRVLGTESRLERVTPSLGRQRQGASFS